jgi:hypothetical protein
MLVGYLKNKFRTVHKKLEIKDPPGFLKPDYTRGRWLFPRTVLPVSFRYRIKDPPTQICERTTRMSSLVTKVPYTQLLLSVIQSNPDF